jgi:hypothetical protein
MRCPNCEHEIHPRSAWLTSSGNFYCSEFCAEPEATDRPSFVPARHSPGYAAETVQRGAEL